MGSRVVRARVQNDDLILTCEVCVKVESIAIQNGSLRDGVLEGQVNSFKII